MSINSETKKALVEHLTTTIDKKLSAIQQEIADIRESMANDTKSSAGDKFETGREMMQIELNKNQDQLNKQLGLKKDLAQIDLHKTHTNVDFGSLVITNKGHYFMPVALGKINVDGVEYFALSMASPVGQALKGAKLGDEISFNKQRISVAAIY
ncbi:3-oxoacyl-ACP synthase [Carboxylicivirga sp. M1479]|uniref:3-oxoacyl-ACP synthase n=1 Tax=Carboxylicivirga sp. M1479 TaxID=2594476 RepID=UPI001177CCE7|nr:3-oxoacyl-ACP synthase [Carboxylicivirga sp. M1479]TRX70936.1 3-oxoacyl-ACP synthase [Carboxylicivirga sp. M1479]